MIVISLICVKKHSCNYSTAIMLFNIAERDLACIKRVHDSPRYNFTIKMIYNCYFSRSIFYREINSFHFTSFFKGLILSPINAWIVFMDRSKSDETLGFSLCLERTNAGQTFKQVSQLCLVKMVFSLCPKITYSAPVNNSKYILSKQCF